MKPFTGNIIEIAKANSNYRKEVATVTGSQVVVMSIPPNDDVGEEVHHDVDQTLLFVAGTGKTVLNGEEGLIEMGTMAVVPRGTRHNFINMGEGDLKIVTVYAPPHHKVGTVHATKADAEADTEDHYE
ncbi:cupin [Candidatus Uhrbacteria bacterium CG22_combo_CG10-13_8_21_14_all_47_17]|uniref:Cupin n=1 Tax=Candidatus Uhrbacteria bacterium CG22_combo_CG10-13_8_21_14_all_47_17 TaxID=1975041 RepID=A0A2H0BTE7_9BACT|nr:MAG: cupin [Candidatus Uhrbacteria bacterium CG22_combo_CG10-13_8_21_14_all_47_17]